MILPRYIEKNSKKQVLGSLRLASFTSKLLIIGNQSKTMPAEGFQELVLERKLKRTGSVIDSSLQLFSKIAYKPVP
jgi:hypothetical protein